MSLPAKSKSQHWQRVADGWLRFDGPEKTSVPYKMLSGFEGIAGLDMNNPQHGSCFNWVWPDEEIVRIYEAANAERERYLAERAARRANLDAAEALVQERKDAAEDESANVTEQIDAIAAMIAQPEPAEGPEQQEETIGGEEPVQPKKSWWRR